MESNKENVWFFVKDSQQQGPVCLFELRKLLEQIVLSGDTFVWNKSMNNWQMAKSLDTFSCPLGTKRNGNPIWKG
jgi:hypothetical protein